MGAYPPGCGRPPVQAPKSGGDKTRTFILVAVIIALVVVAGGAGFYFLVIKKGGEATGPEQTVNKYIDAVTKGDTEAMKALYAPGSQPSDLALRMASSVYSSGILKLSDVKLKTLSQTATDATVQVVDATISVSIAGQSIKQNLSALRRGSETNNFKLKNANGQWLITSDGGLNLVPRLPGVPTSPSNPGT